MTVGPHLQGGADDWDRGMAFLPYWSPAKFVDGGQRAAEAKALDQRHHCHLRHHVGEQNPPQTFARVASRQILQPADKFIPDPEWNEDRVEAEEKAWYTARHNAFFNKLPVKVIHKGGGTFEVQDSFENMKNHARAYFASFIDASFDSFARHIDSVSEYNEYFSNSQDQHERARWISWARACVEVWRDEYRPQYPWIGLVLAETAVGNDIPVELAAMSHQYEWVHLGYHPYVPVWRGTIRPDAWRWYSGRWKYMDDSYRAAGYTHVTWFFGEFGAVGHTRAPEGDHWFNALDPMGGWKHKDVYNGNREAYANMMIDWIEQAAATRVYKEGRFFGATVFTSGGGGLWKWFELKGDDIIEVFARVGAHAKQMSPPGTEPIDPPLPEDDGLVNGYFGNRNWSDIPGTSKQRPFAWSLSSTPVGNMLPSGRKRVTTLSESVHKFVIPTYPDTRPTLPAHEGYGMTSEGHTWDDGRDGLVLENPNTYKTFGTGTWHDRLYQVAKFGAKKANKSYKMTAYVDVHWHGFPPGNNPPAEEDITVSFMCGGNVEVWTSHDLPDRTWRKVVIVGKTTDKGEIYVGVDIEAYWAHPRTVWIGGFELEEIDDAPPPDKCEAREPYNRTVWVIPSSASQEQWNKVAHDAKVFGRSVTGSYDDAGIGCGLTSRTAVLFGIEMADRKMFVDWYNEHYTGTVVEFRPLPVVTRVPQLDFALPLDGEPEVTQRFGDNYEVYMQRYGIPGHNGIDWAANIGDPVLAAYDGVMLASGYDDNGYGLFVTVQHEQGLRTTYAHLIDAGPYAPGVEVKKGEKIAVSGDSGWSSGPHLHFGVTLDGESVNPEAFLGPLV